MKAAVLTNSAKAPNKNTNAVYASVVLPAYRKGLSLFDLLSWYTTNRFWHLKIVFACSQEIKILHITCGQ